MFFGGIQDETAILDRPGQLDSVDFVGCIKSISINGNDKNLITESLNKTGLKDTCNYVESGSCSRGDECGPTGKFFLEIKVSLTTLNFPPKMKNYQGQILTEYEFFATKNWSKLIFCGSKFLKFIFWPFVIVQI